MRNEGKQIEKSENVPLELPLFFTPPSLPSQSYMLSDLIFKLGMASASSPPPPAHDYEEEVNLEVILENKSLTEFNLETIFGRKEMMLTNNSNLQKTVSMRFLKQIHIHMYTKYVTVFFHYL